MQTPWMSIVIPVYNAELFLERCLNSILEQTYKDFEVILVDDGSSDSTCLICSRYASADNRIRYYRKDNRGPLHSRIYGSKLATGNYITFCDADDYYTARDAFSRIYDELRDGTYSVLQFGHIKKYNHMYRKSKAVDSAEVLSRQEFMEQEYPKLLCSFWDGARIDCCVWDKVYHRDLFAGLPEIEERVFWGDDLILNLHLCAGCSAFRIIPDTLYCYCILSGGTKKFSTNTMKDLDAIKRYQLRFLEQYQGKSKDRMLKTLHSEVAGWFFVYIQESLDYLDDAEVRSMIMESLALPSFALSIEYYSNHIEENREEACLLRKADADVYLKKAKQKRKQVDIKQSVKQFLRKIYISI